jgi:hypothetical protein
MPVLAAAAIGAEASLLGGSMQVNAAEMRHDNLHKRNLNLHELRLKRLSFALLV